MKNLIIVIGMWGVGKSHFCDKFIAEHPEYRLFPADARKEDFETCDYGIMDYYFHLDRNANKLQSDLGCNIRKIVIFDTPENISYRQFILKDNFDDGSCWASINLYNVETLRSLVNPEECEYYNSTTGVFYNLESFKQIFSFYLEPYTKEMIEEKVREMQNTEGLDWGYHEFDLPENVRTGKDGYARNKPSWNVIKDIMDFKGKRVLDIGCFLGYFCQEIYKLGGIPSGVDRHPHALYYASIFGKITNTKFSLHKSDVNKKSLELIPGEFDVALCLSMFHHIEEKEYLLTYLNKIPQTIFEVNVTNVEEIGNVMKIVQNIDSPKDNRRILLCEGQNV